ncbi:Fic family protein [Tannerella forsythia]|uniref:type II toxin-antitoxin system death-on-curing family toxin n=1 Tax=Tannerella forsythia TaxID=28112 RepID=UPI0028E685BB|nr:Fic family protein [Tannerella forsythia]
MNNEMHYISYEEALEVYRKMIVASGGGFAGVRDEGGILATLDFIQNDDYYPTITEKLSCLVFRFCSGHYFNDGNKRIALTLGAYFLHKNNYLWEACIFMRQLEAIVYHIAASHISQDLLLRIMTSFMSGQDYDEELKIDIANAIDDGELGINGEDYNKGD